MQIHEELRRRERELRRRVDEVLFYIWDPIGVSNEPCARGEYTGYVAPVLGRLLGDNAEASVSAYLLSTAPRKRGLEIRRPGAVGIWPSPWSPSSWSS